MTRVPPLLRSITVLAVLAVAAQPLRAEQRPAVESPGPAPAYAFIADLVLAAPVIADVVIRDAVRVKDAEAAGAPPGSVRLYVTADVLALIRGPGELAARMGWVVDVPAAADGRPPKLRKARILVFARIVPGAGDQLQLISSDAQLPWTAAADALTRRIARDVIAADAPPVITGVGNAFHVPGALPGEGETQVFLKTADARPVSLSVLRRPGERPRWAVALSEIVDEAAAPPAPDTLLWYRLACSLPPVLPDASAASLSTEDAAVAREDYRFVADALGACGARARLER